MHERIPKLKGIVKIHRKMGEKYLPHFLHVYEQNLIKYEYVKEIFCLHFANFNRKLTFLEI